METFSWFKFRNVGPNAMQRLHAARKIRPGPTRHLRLPEYTLAVYNL